MKTTTLLPTPQYGLDIDGVLANFIEALISYAYTHCPVESLLLPASWREWYSYDSHNPEAFRKVYKEITHLPSFWRSIEPLEEAVSEVKALPYLPTVYITSRPIPTEVTLDWLASVGLPTAPVVTVASSAEKVQHALEYGLTHFVDDLPGTCDAMQRAGITALLFDQPHNTNAQCSVEAPYTRIRRLTELAPILESYVAKLSKEQTLTVVEPHENRCIRVTPDSRLSLTEDTAERNKYPMADGLLYYFPNALAEVSKVSRIGNEQHNAGQPMHWARGKSKDHANKIVRHLIDAGKVDQHGVRHTAALAWRALAMLQEELEQSDSRIPLPRNAKTLD